MMKTVNDIITEAALSKEPVNADLLWQNVRINKDWLIRVYYPFKKSILVSAKTLREHLDEETIQKLFADVLTTKSSKRTFKIRKRLKIEFQQK